MSDSVERDAIDTIKEELDQRFPEFVSRHLRGADNLDSLIGILFDLYASIPDLSSPVFIFLAERLQGRGGVLGLVGQFVNTIPSTSRMLRGVTGKTPEAARADVVAHWKKFKKNPRIGATMATPAATSPATPTPAAVPAASLSRVQQAVAKAAADGGFTDRERLMIVYMFRIMRIEGAPGRDVVAELEGEARNGKRGLIDTVVENNADLKVMFAAVPEDMDRAWGFYEAMREVERDNSVASTNKPEWRKAAANFVRQLMPIIEFILLGHAERHAEPAAAAAMLDLIDRLNLFADLEPSSAFVRAQEIKNTVRNTSFGLLAAFALIILYFLAVVQEASTSPEHLGEFAWLSTWIILGGAALLTVFGAAIRKTWVALTGAFTIFAISPVVLTVAWVVAAVFTPVPDWRAFWMALIVVLGLDFITFSLTQKMIQTVGGIPSFILSFFPNKEAAKEAAEKITKSSFLASISSTIASAIVLLWVPIVGTYVLGTPVAIRIGTVAVIAVFACGHGYLKRGATMTDFTAYKSKKFAEEAEAQAVNNFKLAYGGLKLVTLGSLGLYVVVFIFGMTPLLTAKDTAAHGAARTIGIVSDGGSRVLDYAENAVGTPAAQPVQQAQPAPVEAHKPKIDKRAADLEALGGASYCAGLAAQGMGDIYPCGN